MPITPTLPFGYFPDDVIQVICDWCAEVVKELHAGEELSPEEVEQHYATCPRRKGEGD